MRRSLAGGGTAGIVAGVVGLAAIAGIVIDATNDNTIEIEAQTTVECWDIYNLNRAKQAGPLVAGGGSPINCTAGDLNDDGQFTSADCQWSYAANLQTVRYIYVPFGKTNTLCPNSPPVPPTTTLPPTTTVVPTSTTTASTTTMPGTTTTTTSTSTTTTTTLPPNPQWNPTLPLGSTLPSEATCTARIRRMTENRPNNTPFNNTRGTAPNATYPRVTGNFVGTTDEILQWTACKWGIDEDWVRAQIVTESFWDQRVVGDTAAGDGCTSHGLGQVRRCYHDNAFENAVNSSAYNLDYTYAIWRACYEGQFTWLNTVERGHDYAAGDLLGCMGVWFSGRWYTQPAVTYMSVVQGHFDGRPWLQSSFPPAQPVGNPPSTTTTVPGTTTTTTTIPPTTTLPPTVGGFLATFDGAPTAPVNFEDDWFIAKHKRSKYFGDELIDAMAAEHGSGCQAPPATHTVNLLADTVFRCTAHVMTAINADDYGAVYLTPPALVDFSAGTATISVDVSTLRKSGRDWWDIWITPPAEYLQLPLPDWLPDLHGYPEAGVHIYMDFETNRFGAHVFRNGIVSDLPFVTDADYDSVLTESATRRDQFKVTISTSHLTFGMPGYGLTWLDTSIAPALTWNKALVQLSHHSYSPNKSPRSVQPNTWHWDNMTINPSVPVMIVNTDEDWAEGSNPTMLFNSPTPAGHVSFSAIGSAIQLRFNGGAWANVQLNAPQAGQDEHYRSYWHPIPQGTTTVEFRGSNWWGGQWYVSDVAAFGV